MPELQTTLSEANSFNFLKSETDNPSDNPAFTKALTFSLKTVFKIHIFHKLITTKSHFVIFKDNKDDVVNTANLAC